MTIDDATDYIITKVCEGGGALNVLKLQKLLYYAQAWKLAFDRQPLFPGRFQAWIHGPVNRQVYDRFAETKNLYSSVEMSDRREGFNPDTLDSAEREHIDSVLEVYAGYTGTQLEVMTHLEKPWQDARAGVRPAQRCEQEVDESAMAEFYGARVGQ